MTDSEIFHKNNEIITKFLDTNFNTKRIKIDGTFKRAMVIDGGFTGKQTYYLLPKSKDYKQNLYMELHQIIKDVLGYSNNEIDLIVYNYVHGKRFNIL